MVAGVLLASATYASAQFGRGGRGLFGGVRLAPMDFPDRDFTLCRIMYQSVRSEADGAGWATDYPGGDNNLLLRLGELTRTRVSHDGTRQPNHWVVRLTDDALFNCPYTVASDVGTMGLSETETTRLRDYLLKGGFLWVDDFWGNPAWAQWSQVIARVLPGMPIEDVPLSDPIFSSQFVVTKVIQVPRYPFWVASGGQTSERGAETREPHFRGIRDDHGRLMVVMTHNTDVADSWEREGEQPEYFLKFSVDGYALGVNVLLYAQSH
ncbi:MAG: DUF4159 domain-containing protein [Vicinamibacterales bacterium]